MKIVNTAPPMFEEIAAAFPDARGPGVLFCWGENIHVPRPAGEITPELIAHERVHCVRQGADIAGWWRRYIADQQFRLLEEFPAHVAEFKALCELHSARWVSQRSMRRIFAARIGRKLASPLYGSMIDVSDAKELILEAARSGVDPAAMALSTDEMRSDDFTGKFIGSDAVTTKAAECL